MFSSFEIYWFNIDGSTETRSIPAIEAPAIEAPTIRFIDLSIEGLFPFRNYTVVVGFTNSKGSSPFSAPAFATTMEDSELNIEHEQCQHFHCNLLISIFIDYS